MSEAAFEPGTVLAGRFHVEALLGRGGFGAVLRARDTRLGRVVAIKYMQATAKGTDEDAMRTRLLREARAAAGLSHPHVIQVFDVGETDDGDVYVVMELVEGQSFREIVYRNVMPFHERVRVLIESAQALQSAHAMGLVHRDIKPDNIMVRRDGRTVVLDFGIAKKLAAPLSLDEAGQSTDTNLTRPGTVVGTPAYLSPEQVLGQEITGKADQFALAVTAWEALTGRLPWTNQNPMMVMSEIVLKGIEPPSTTWEGFPRDLDPVLLKALAKSPAERFSDMDAFAEALKPFRWYGTENPEAARIPTPPPKPRPQATVDAEGLEALASPPRASAPPVIVTENHGGSPGITPTRVSTDDLASVVAARPGSDAPKPVSTPPRAASTQSPPLLRSMPPARFEASLPLEPPPRVIGPWIKVAAMVVPTLALLAVALFSVHRSGLGSSNLSPLATASSVLACPPFVVHGEVPEPSGWFGAAAASAACHNAMDHLGGDPDRVRVPAELLGFRTTPADDAPVDPYAPTELRARAVEAARRDATVWVDGEVTYTREAITVSLQLRRSTNGQVFARVEHRHEDFLQAVRGAVATLVRQGHIPGEGPVSPVAREWRYTDRRDALLLWQRFFEDDFRDRQDTLQGPCEALQHSDEPLGRLAPIARVECGFMGLTPPPMHPVTVDRSTAGSLAFTSRYHVVSGGHDNVAELEAALRAADARGSRVGRGLLLEAQAEMAQTQGDTQRARELSLLAVQADPRQALSWSRLLSVNIDERGAQAIARTYGAWFPENVNVHRWISSEFTAREPESLRRYAQRPMLLAPHYNAGRLRWGLALIALGATVEARSVRAEMPMSSNHGRAQARTLLEVALSASEGRFVTALDQTLASLEAASPSMNPPAMALIQYAMTLAEILGRRVAVADRLVARYLVPEVRASRFGPTAIYGAALCASASSAVSEPCFRSLDAALARGHFLARLPSYPAVLAGAKAYAAGDWRAATEAWRPVVREAETTTAALQHLMADAFDRAGDARLGDLLDERFAVQAPMWGGATLAHVRMAQRARARGDASRAQALVGQVESAWVTAEGPPPSLATLQSSPAAVDAGTRRR